MLEEHEIAQLLDIGMAACHNGMPHEARTIFTGVLALRPGFAPALLGQALSHIVVDDFTPAEHIITQQVLMTNPNDKDAWCLLGLCLSLAGRREEAAVWLQKAAEAGGPQADVAAQLQA